MICIFFPQGKVIFDLKKYRDVQLYRETSFLLQHFS